MPDPNTNSEKSIHAEFLSSDELLAAIIDSSDDAIVSKDLNGIVTSWNQGATRVFGYEAAEMVGQPILRIIPPDRREEEPAILQRLRNGERIDHFETVRLRKDGTTVDVSLTISPVRAANGKIVGASKIARDITQQKLAMKKLAEANEQLARADRMKVEFISTLSHELRTPLTSIVGWIQMLKEDPNTEDLKQGLEVIERNVRVQSQLINDLLDMSRIETGKMTLDLQPLDLPAAILAAIDVVRPSAETKEIKITFAFDSVNGIVMGDRNRMQQIVWNLLTNAVKFTPRKGRIHVTVERANSHIEIAVTDTGNGIPPEFLQSIFQRFTQADSTTTRKHGGLGIGLSISKHLVELHGGSIVAKSEGIGLGSTFCVQLPLIPAHEKVQPESDRPATQVDETIDSEDLRGINILVVDDDTDSAEIVSRILARRGATIRRAHCMEEALAAVQGAAPDVLLSDIGMPGHDGYELISRVRALPEGRRIPAVALTALVRNEDRARALRAGFQMHVGKPVDAMELVAVVRNLAELRES